MPTQKASLLLEMLSKRLDKQALHHKTQMKNKNRGGAELWELSVSQEARPAL
jgi:hypothetical protein